MTSMPTYRFTVLPEVHTGDGYLAQVNVDSNFPKSCLPTQTVLYICHNPKLRIFAVSHSIRGAKTKYTNTLNLQLKRSLGVNNG
jgi:hypothetical protein